MKLYHYKNSKGTNNFGDDLNIWLWEKILPNELDDDESVAFIGIGTLLNEFLPIYTSKASQRVIFSTGVGYGKGVFSINDSYKIYCLRGPLSARTLGVSEELAITDGAILVRRLIDNKTNKKYKFSYMPHEKLACELWKFVCEEVGFGYIDPRWSTEQILSCICQTEILLTEAMHGAIVADALRVPWIPVVTSSDILPFKWQDWCMSMGVEYNPKYIVGLEHPRTDRNKLNALVSPVRLALSYPLRKLAGIELNRISKISKPTLSSNSLLERRTVQLEEMVAQFKVDIKCGYFF